MRLVPLRDGGRECARRCFRCLGARPPGGGPSLRLDLRVCGLRWSACHCLCLCGGHLGITPGARCCLPPLLLMALRHALARPCSGAGGCRPPHVSGLCAHTHYHSGECADQQIRTSYPGIGARGPEDAISEASAGCQCNEGCVCVCLCVCGRRHVLGWSPAFACLQPLLLCLLVVVALPRLPFVGEAIL